MARTAPKTHDQEDAGNSMLMDTALDWQFDGTWDEYVGRAQKCWGHLTDDKVAVTKGQFQALAGRIQRSTGERLEDIHRRLFEDRF